MFDIEFKPKEAATQRSCRVGGTCRAVRVVYNLDKGAEIVTIEAIGFKIGSQLFIRGEKRTL